MKNVIVVTRSQFYFFNRSLHHIIMRILFDLKKINGSFNYKGKIRLRIKIGQVLTMTSELCSFIDGSYAFLEKQTAKIDKLNNQQSVQLSIIAETGVQLGQITIFLVIFREKKTLEIRNLNELYTIHYDCIETAEEDGDLRLTGTLGRTSSDGKVSTQSEEQSGKLQFLKIGKLVFDFVQRLDPIIFIYHKLIDLLAWKQPSKTISFGIVLTLVIYNMKMAIFISGLLLYFGRVYLFKRLYRLQQFKDNHRRLIVPQQNAYFLQSNMENYIEYYQKVSEFLFSDDKTILINIINLLCKMGILLILLLFFFQVQHIIVFTLWGLLLMTSPYRNFILNYTKPLLQFLMGEYSRIINKISVGLVQVLGTSQVDLNQMRKEFYFYKYERWWMVQGWLEEKKKFSDQDYQCVVIPKENAPPGWAWVQEWKVELYGQTDSDGYQYANEFKKDFNSNPTLATVRRRRWKRVCAKLR